MPHRCQICQKGGLKGYLVSHSHHKVKRTQKPNLHKVKLEGKRIILCSSCLKTRRKSSV